MVEFIGFQKEKNKTANTFLFQCFAAEDTSFFTLNMNQYMHRWYIFMCRLSYLRYYRCHIQGYMMVYFYPFTYISHLTSIWITVFLGIIRFVAVCYPLHFENMLPCFKRISLLEVVILALFSIVMGGDSR